LVTLTKSQIIAALPKLPVTELNEVVAVAQSLLGGHTGAVAGSADRVPALLLDAIRGAVNAERAWLKPALEHKLIEQSKAVTRYCNKHFPDWDQNRNKQVKFIRFLMELLKSDLIAIKVKPTLTTMINNLHRLYEVVDSAYPGYAEAGLYNVIFRKLMTGDPLVVQAYSE
jgi:hypothetical protein